MLTHWNRLTQSPSLQGHSDLYLSSSQSVTGAMPEPLDMGNFSGIIAAGVDSSARIALGHDRGLSMTLNHGPLDDERNLVRYDDSLRLISRHFPPSVVAIDSHRGLASSRVARALASRAGASLIPIDHAHAHAAAIMAEHGIKGSVIGIILDKAITSHHSDSHTFRSSEMIVCTPSASETIATGDPIVLPRNAEPWEAAVAVILHYAGSLSFLPRGFVEAVGKSNILDAARRCSDKSTSVAVLGGSAIWDAVASLIATENGEAAGALAGHTSLQAPASGLVAAPYSIDSRNPLSPEDCLSDIITDLAEHTDPRVIAARFHTTCARAWAIAASRVAVNRGIKRAVISGDLTCNRLLLRQLRAQLSSLGITPYFHSALAATDASIALGQAYVAAALRA
ncbi:MAG: hypothetical protein NC342_03610 [Pseudoflavonifractor sp.]|nr:hypothetical protein [Alloprevotella sp.]MCM1116602.1 hypothetical protein [Pseudoflavonifractor sp.]